MKFNLNHYYELFAEYAYEINDETTYSELKTLEEAMKNDFNDAAHTTLELINESKLPTVGELEEYLDSVR